MVSQQFGITKKTIIRGKGMQHWCPTVRGEVHVNTGDDRIDREIGSWLRDVNQRIQERVKDMKTTGLVLLALLVAASASAQTTTLVVNKTITFDVDVANYTGQLKDGVTAIVQAVQFDAVGMNGNGAVALSYVLPAKPPADANGHVGPVSIAPAFTSATADKAYTWKLSFIGPNGTAAANAPDPFVLATPIPPKPATNLHIQ
jgi:hypothetical protein